MWGTPRFDLHQFYRRAHAVSASTGISFADYLSSMHVMRHTLRANRLEVPAWALNDKELREIVLKCCERRLYIRHARRTGDSFTTPTSLTDEQRLARIREEELRQVERLRSTFRSLIARQKAEPDNKNLEEQIQNVDSQIRTSKRGSVGLAIAIAYMSYRLGWESSRVAEELGIHPPLVRQTLARFHHAANGTVYCSPKQQRVREARAQMKRINTLFDKLKKITDAANRQAAEAELQAIVNAIPKAATGRKNQWTLDRLRLLYFLRLQGKTWESLAPKFGVKHGGSLQNGFRFWMKNMHKLPDFAKAT